MPPISPYAEVYSPFSAGGIPGILVDPDEGQLVTFRFHPAWQPVVTGALKAVIQPQLWNVSQDAMQLQIERAGLLLSLANQANNQNRPFYQNAEEAESDTPDDYPWYEQASDWVIEAFVAYTFTPEAAIAYRVIIPNLRIAVRTGNVGAVFKVLINGLEYMTGDSYAPITGILENVINVGDFATEHGLGVGPWMMQIVNMGRPTLLAETTPAKLEVMRGDIRVEDSGMTTTLRADPDGCGVQWSTDGTNWHTIDLSGCITGLANSAIDQALADGTIPKPGGQPDPADPPNPGICVTHHVQLNGKNRWMIPSPLNAGDVVSITDARGGWSDGTPLWYCPDGRRYALGGCTGDGTYEEADPVTSEFHMVPIIGYGETPAYGGNLSLGFIVPAGVANEQGWIQANDASLNDNYGEIEFDLTVCSGGWCYQFDWTTGDKLNWEVNANPNDNHVEGYWAGNGWHTHGTPYWNLWMQFQALLPADVHITQMDMDIEIPSGTHAYAPLIAWQPSGGGASTFLTSQPEQNGPFDGTITVTHNVEWPGAGYLWLLGGTNSGGGFTLKRVRFYGNGACPFGTPNC